MTQYNTSKPLKRRKHKMIFNRKYLRKILGDRTKGVSAGIDGLREMLGKTHRLGGGQCLRSEEQTIDGVSPVAAHAIAELPKE